jgi:magnesium-transporting ATPase (P-type)
LPDERRRLHGVADEAGLTLVGYVAFLDPPKETPPRRWQRWPAMASP